MVWQDRKQSIFNTFNGYQGGNRLITCNPEKHQGNYTIPTPTFSLFMTKDPVADWAYFAGMLGSANYLPNHYNACLFVGPMSSINHLGTIPYIISTKVHSQSSYYIS